MISPAYVYQLIAKKVQKMYLLKRGHLLLDVHIGLSSSFFMQRVRSSMDCTLQL